MPIMKAAKWICDPNDERPTFPFPWEQEKNFNSRDVRLPDFGGISVFLKAFRPKGAATRVTVRATALGVFELFLNGHRIGVTDASGASVFDEMKPGWTDYRFRVFAFEYDVTALLGKDGGENLFAAELSRGWWSGRISFGVYGFPTPAFLGELEITYADGTTELIATDASWSVTRNTPMRSADIWDGVYYDARIPSPAVALPAEDLPKAILYEGATCEPEWHVGETVRVSGHLERRPESATVWKGTDENGTEYGRIRIRSEAVGDGCERCTLHAGESLLLDMGQNTVGRPHFRIRAARGTTVECYVAEMKNDTGDPARGNDGPAGSLYIKNYRSALARLVYVASGDGIEDFFPTHTFYGYRYLEFTADADVEILSIAGEILRSDLRETSSFSCSNEEVNKLFSNILWGQRCNYLSIPTDCPQRDERLGWTGDTQVFCGAAAYNMDVRLFLRKWLGDLRHSQIGADGAYSDIAPRIFIGHGRGHAAWGDAGLIVPYRLYLMYGDTDVILEHYASMEDYMTYLTQYGMDGPRKGYGDWLNYDPTDKSFIARAYYANDARLMTRFSEILAEKCAGTDREAFYRARAAHYADLHGKIKAAFLADHYAEKELTVRTQTSCLLALHFDLIPREDRDRTVRRLKRLLSENGFTLSTGFLGTGLLCTTLQECGVPEYAYSLLLQTRDPSWLYSVREGATTVWERWNSYTHERGFGEVSMNSFNHYAYGAVAEWMMSGIAGILPDPECVGFRRFRLFPTPDTRRGGMLPDGQERITHAEATYDSVCGRIASAWSTESGNAVYRFTVPAGTEAEVGLLLDAMPDYCGTLTLNGVPTDEEALGIREEGGRIRFTLTAGTYEVKV